MKEYSFSEIGMLAGAAAGGCVAVLFFSFTGNVLSFSLAGIGITVGILLGNMMDKRFMNKGNGDEAANQ